MVSGWRRAFCTSVVKERETPIFSDKKQTKQCDSNMNNAGSNTSNSSHSPRISSKFGFFSNPSTPRLQTHQQQSQSNPSIPTSLRCKTSSTAANTTPSSSVPNSPKLQCNNKKSSISPRLFHFSNPSSPKSPSTFSLLKATLRLSKSRCGICLQSVKTHEKASIFTAECSHVFHVSCITKTQMLLICPVCNATWKHNQIIFQENASKAVKNLRVYNDDEPLLSPSPGSLFNPIPEDDLDECESKISAEEFQGFFVNPNHHGIVKSKKNMDFSILPESAVVTVGKNYQTHVYVLKVRAPPCTTARRLPIDLVMVLDVSDRMGGGRLQMMKRLMRVVVSTLNSNDRLSIVAFSGSSKRLLPLRRMTGDGRRAARRIVEAIVSTGQGMSANDALKKAVKVIEDRRVKNPVASVIIISNGQDDRSHNHSFNQKRSSLLAVSSTRSPQLEIPVHSISLENTSALSNHAPLEDSITKSITGLLRVSIQDVKLQIGFVSSGSTAPEITAVYPLSGRTDVFGPDSVRLGDLYAEEERELLMELKVYGSSIGSHHVLSVRSSSKDAASQEIVLSKKQALLLPRSQTVRSSLPNIQRLRDLHVSTRAIAESRRLIEYCDLSGAYHMLSSARALLLQSMNGSANEYVRGLEAELGELHRKRQQMERQQMGQSRNGQQIEEKAEPLTPTSAWRAAERLAKVAIMRKHMNRVSDLHGFENARF